MKNRKLNWKHIACGIYKCDCPRCGHTIQFLGDTIDVNCYSRGEVVVPGLISLYDSCDNPLCEWSVVK